MIKNGNLIGYKMSVLMRSDFEIWTVNRIIDANDDTIVDITQSVIDEMHIRDAGVILQWVVTRLVDDKMVIMNCMGLYEMSEKIHRLELGNAKIHSRS
jgi:hypothetical protein